MNSSDTKESDTKESDTKEKDALQAPLPEEDSDFTAAAPESEKTPSAEKRTESPSETEKTEETPDKLEGLGLLGSIIEYIFLQNRYLPSSLPKLPRFSTNISTEI